MAESRCLLAGGSLVFGSFRCASDDPLWNAENCMPHGHHIVFPRVPVLISGIQEREVVAAPNTLMFYNRGDQYRRRAVDERGDACEWLIVSDTLLWDLLRELDPDRHGSPDRPFAHRAAPSVPRCYAAQRLIWQELAHGAAPDALALEESLLALLPEILSTAQRAWRRRPVPRRPSTHRAN